MESRLRLFYVQHDPSKVANIAAIMTKYAGRERELFEFLRKKCVRPQACLDSCFDIPRFVFQKSEMSLQYARRNACALFTLDISAAVVQWSLRWQWGAASLVPGSAAGQQGRSILRRNAENLYADALNGCLLQVQS
jgi:hypothetical protein